MPSTKLHKWVCLAEKRVGIALDKKYLQMKNPEPLVQNQNNFTEMILMLPSTLIDQKFQLGRTTRLPELKIEISFKSYHWPLNHLLMCQDKGARSRVLGPSCFNR